MPSRALPLVLIALLAGCGASEPDRVRAAAQDYVRAILDGDGAAACELLAGPARREAAELGVGGCEAALDGVTADLDADERDRILAVVEDDSRFDVGIEGDEATAIIDTARGDVGDRIVDLVRIDGDWVIAMLDGGQTVAAGLPRDCLLGIDDVQINDLGPEIGDSEALPASLAVLAEGAQELVEIFDDGDGIVARLVSYTKEEEASAFVPDALEGEPLGEIPEGEERTAAYGNILLVAYRNADTLDAVERCIRGG